MPFHLSQFILGYIFHEATEDYTKLLLRKQSFESQMKNTFLVKLFIIASLPAGGGREVGMTVSDAWRPVQIPHHVAKADCRAFSHSCLILCCPTK